MFTVSKAFKLLRFPARFQSSLRPPIPQLRPLLRFSTTTTAYAPSPKQKPRSPKQKPRSPKQKPRHTQEHCYGSIPLRITGTHFYEGIASWNEPLVVHRDPRNLYVYGYDTFRVDKANGATFGYVPAILAKKLAPLVDEGLVTLNIRANGHRTASIKFFGVGEIDARVQTLLDTENTTEKSLRIYIDHLFPHWTTVLFIHLRLYFRRTLEDTCTKFAKAAATAFQTVFRKRKLVCIYAVILLNVPASIRVTDKLILRRESRNRAHPHAIRVYIGDGAESGYIPFSVSTGLAPYVDEGLITLEGQVLSRPRGWTKGVQPVAIMVLGPREHSKYERLKAELIQKGISPLHFMESDDKTWYRPAYRAAKYI